ncbi:MAG: VIT domain-containing protein [Myxococcota bacterium]|nr:VIT domain-containing protein [Myxococcota bacterium]
MSKFPVLSLLIPLALLTSSLACGSGPTGTAEAAARHPATPMQKAQQRLAQGPVPSATLVARGHEVTQGALQVTTGTEAWELPLVHTHVDAEISGFLADVEVSQLYANPFDEPIEVVYLFPLPEKAAVNDMQMRIGDRVIVGEIKKRAEAKAIYEAARDGGKTAALLDQERPNVFQQSVANILPGEAIEVTIHFIQPLDYEDGGYEWVFPMVVGPRFIPEQGTGESGGADSAEDARRLQAPVSAERTGNDITVSVLVDAGLDIQDLRSPSHQIEVDRPGSTQADVSLAPHETVPNKDFILRYDVAGRAPEMAFLTHRRGEDGTFLLVLQPQTQVGLRDQSVTPKEMVFVLDTSCSQSGEPLAKSKEAVALAIREMNPDDRFWILNFNSSVSALSTNSLANTAANRKRGLEYIRSFRGSGGTNMDAGIRAALDLPRDPKLLRTVIFMTDGYIGNDSEILSTLEEHLGDSRLFSFGIGSSTNRHLLNRLAKLGRGRAQYIRQDEDPAEQIADFYDRIRNPVLTDIELTWDGMELLDLYPDPIPDLFSAQPLVIVGRYTEAAQGTITVTGQVRGRAYQRRLKVSLPESQDTNAALPALWARTVIADLEDRSHGRRGPHFEDEITQLALEHRLMTRFTSFVAVEERTVTEGDGPPRRVRVPLETPEGVDHSAVFDDDLEAESYRMRKRQRSSMYATGNTGGQFRGGMGTRGRGAGASGYGQGGGFLGKVAPRAEPTEAAPAPVVGALVRPDTDTPPPASTTATARVEVSGSSRWGSLNSELAQSEIERRLRGLQTAWEGVAASKGQGGGSWTIRLSVNRDGRVTAVHFVSDRLRSPSMRTSFESQVTGWWLSPPTDARATTVELTLTFSLDK